MKLLDMREEYPDSTDTERYVEVSDEVMEYFAECSRAKEAYRRKNIRYGGVLSLDSDDGLENEVVDLPLSAEQIIMDEMDCEELYEAVMSLPDKQSRRIQRRYYLEARVEEIAVEEGVAPRRVWDSLKQGIGTLKNKLKNF